MSTTSNFGPLIVKSGETVSLSQRLISSGGSNASYLIVNGYDRNEYTVNASGTTGSFTGNGHTLSFSSLGGDARGAGIVFALNASTGRYSNSTYGYLDQLTYIASTSADDVTHISLFSTNTASIAYNYASNAISLAQHDASGYLGTVTVASPTGFTSAAPAQATPFSIAAIAQTFVGSACNRDGCWTLASTISAEAGASLPVQSAVAMAGAANGEWMVAYNGPAGSTGDWASTVRTGDMVGFVTAAGTGHITTIVSGAGSTAMVVDNATLVDAQGNILNSANDGSAKDIVVQAAHAASQEWAGVSASSVVIFRLDTPVVATLQVTLNVVAGGTANLASFFAATDPAGKPITSYQAYSATSSDWFTVNGSSVVAASAATAVTASSLSQINFDRGASDVADDVIVRAYNGSFWGDWTKITASINPTSVSHSLGMDTARVTTSDNLSIHRFFDKTDGTHFFTASSTEASDLAATRTDLSYEGVGLHGYAAADASPSSVAVYRFFDTNYGTHLFTQSASEKASILSTRPDLVSEGIAFYAPN